MRVHPALKMIRNINTTSPCHVSSSSFNQKKLRKLPHVFAKVLQLPFHSNADVSVHETSHTFRFTVKTTQSATHAGFRAHIVEIYPGVIKIVVQRIDHQGAGGDHVSVDDDDGDDDQLNLDLWRFRLPAWTRPEMASATCNGQELVVTVPKDLNSEDMIRVNDEGEYDEEVTGEENGRAV